ncbi:hypothetical protein [Acetobacterium sp. MES1]|nr:hypothetical protein [Acetobacterium sp. MES1]
MNKEWKMTGKKRIGQNLANGLTCKELLVIYEKECKRKGVSEITF